MFHVVEFFTMIPKEVAVVPEKWISSDFKTCAWPSTRIPNKINKLTEKCADPKSDWKSYEIRSLHKYGEALYCAYEKCMIL